MVQVSAMIECFGVHPAALPRSILEPLAYLVVWGSALFLQRAVCVTLFSWVRSYPSVTRRTDGAPLNILLYSANFVEIRTPGLPTSPRPFLRLIFPPDIMFETALTVVR